MPKLRAFTMPKWGIEMVEGTINEWSVKEGEPVAKGQTIVLIETDKIVNEVEAEGDTRFAKILAEPGATLPVGELLGVMADGDASAAEVDAFIRAFKGEPPAVAAAPGTSPPSAPTPSAAAPGAAVPGAVPAASANAAQFDGAVSPAARALAQRAAVDLNLIKGSGRKGRVTFQDVLQASKPVRAVGGGAPVSIMPKAVEVPGIYASPAAAKLAAAEGIDLQSVRGTGRRGRISLADIAPAFKVIRMSPMRKAIARQLTLSKTTVPHFYVRGDVNFDALIALRAAEKARTGDAPGINDYLVKAAALALMEVPEVNIQVHGDEIRQFAHADIAVAVATDKGLITPILRAAESKTAAQVSQALRPLVTRARAGALRAHEIEGGSFSISNLGMFGVDQFDAIINVPQGAILAVGAARRVCIERGTMFGFASVATLSLSCDHRAIDGALGGRFLTVLRRLLESPGSL
jgi:pyruvate dehydrogenase E2 component (dihydrolipoamide acetyltransferase)